MSLWKFVGKLCSFAYERLFRFSSALLIPQVHLHPDIRKLSMNQFLIFDENLVLQTSYPGKFAYKKRIKRNQVKYQSFSGGLSLTKIKTWRRVLIFKMLLKFHFSSERLQHCYFWRTDDRKEKNQLRGGQFSSLVSSTELRKFGKRNSLQNWTGTSQRIGTAHVVMKAHLLKRWPLKSMWSTNEGTQWLYGNARPNT